MSKVPEASANYLEHSLLSEGDIQFILDLAEHCGRIAAEMRESVDIREKAGPQDLVTDADIALSDILLKELGKRFPGDFLISEEDIPAELSSKSSQRIWYLDPIDGTDNYVRGDGQYAVMIGLLCEGRPHFGCVHAPASNTTYYGGTAYGSFSRRLRESDPEPLQLMFDQELDSPVRLMMGYRDRKANLWIQDLDNIKIVSSGSVGLKVAKVLRNEADLFLHLSGKLKYWDTVGPIAIALAAGLEAGTLEENVLSYPLSEIIHPRSVIVGRPGSIAWSRQVMSQHIHE